ncbi:NnrS family protein [Thiomicrorhabdus sediminis]|uniref:NnrS family protein n=1 Tax=Thiomicrorhabdus sediminis TaxID=2580412 RepID=A0A4P9K6P9_9GAMM|nr:NnrS family protein [Thiomicrorhabdus sediminis]QCU90006.1 NnrS family protein [Thiomicrorhabdus sediminis]
MFFNRAFRSFFLAGGLFSALAMFFWWLSYQQQVSFSGIDSMIWHGHEMIYGYALATITGFLLTAVMNWTGLNSASGIRLAALFLLWLAARIGYFFDVDLFALMLIDIAFNIGLWLHFSIPIIKTKQWQQSGLSIKFLLLILTNALFYGSALGYLQIDVLTSLVAGLFLILAINLTMMRRLMPFFTEKAFALAEFKNPKWLDRLAIAGFLLLMVALLLQSWLPAWMVSVIAFPLAVFHSLRWYNWYHAKIWTVLLIWPLYLSYGFMIIGMLLFGFYGLGMVTLSLAIHALAAGGIGLLCSSIMARISLGHTNRNVFEPPRALLLVFVLLVVAALFRVLLPLLDAANYSLWIQVSQWGWILGFLLLSVIYWPILTRVNPLKDHGIRL